MKLILSEAQRASIYERFEDNTFLDSFVLNCDDMNLLMDMVLAGAEVVPDAQVGALPQPIDTKHLGTNECVRAYGWNDCHKEFLPTVSRLQAELAKARELLNEVVDGTGSSPGANKRYGKIRAYLASVPQL